MTTISKIIYHVDRLQRRHKVFAFPYAVIKKYGEDEAGYQAALLTYYGFLALFPLLLVVITVSEKILVNNPSAQNTVLHSITNYFPVLGGQLASHIHSIGGGGYALAVGILFTFYGARGAAAAFTHGVHHIWNVPKKDRDGFPKSLLKNLTLLLIGGIGFIAASVISGIAAGAGHGLMFRALSIFMNLIILFSLFTFLINYSLPKHISFKETRLGAAVCAVGLVMLQLLGGYILTRHLKTLDALYSYFAITLGLLFWIYLQAQLLMYAIEISIVSSHRLWPRSLQNDHPTDVDKKLINGSA